MAGRHLNRAEWDALGEHCLASTPKRQLLIFLGAVLEDAEPGERASVLGDARAARLIWQTYGQIGYAVASSVSVAGPGPAWTRPPRAGEPRLPGPVS